MGKESVFSEEAMEKRISFVESLFTKYGAEQVEMDEKAREKAGVKNVYTYDGSFYKVDALKFDEEADPFIVLSCTDEKKFADLGLFEDIDAFDFTASDEKLEKGVRYAFGIEPYPEDYSSID